jgi:hypothetical protein
MYRRWESSMAAWGHERRLCEVGYESAHHPIADTVEARRN